MSKINKFLIFIIIINLFASIFIIFGEGKKEEVVEEFEIENIGEFTRVYEGEGTSERYTTFVENLIEKRFNKLYKETRNLSDTELKKYYEEKNVASEVSLVTSIQSLYGISDYETFEILIKKLRIIREKDAKYKQSRIIEGSCSKGKDYTTSEIILEYSKFQKIRMTIEMAHSIDPDIQTFKISVKEDK